MLSLAKVVHSVSLRLPQRYALRTGLRAYCFSSQDHNLFWTLFSSPEYLQFFDDLLAVEPPPSSIIDGGAACGYFTLLIEHYIRCGVLPWTVDRYVLVEPLPGNLRKLRINTSANFSDRAIVREGALGEKTGTVLIHTSADHPWGASTRERDTSSASHRVTNVDLTDDLRAGPCLVKLDVEGSEYQFIDNYEMDLDHVVGLILEWHLELGDYRKAVATLSRRGFVSRGRRSISENRSIELFLRSEDTPRR
jgi:FkbM family methyltransferase